MKRNLIKGSAGNVSYRNKDKEDQLLLPRIKAKGWRGEAGLSLATKHRGGRGRQGEKSTQEKPGERQLDKIRKNNAAGLIIA